jgi:putative chitinase
MLTHEQLHAIMPGAPAARSAAFLPFLTAAMAEFAIEAPVRAAAFLAQLAHESGQLRFMEEIWGPTPAQRRYEPVSTLAATLGNTEAGDGLRFKGRGPIQITGRSNYRRFGDLLGVDLVTAPEQAARPELAFRIAGLFWSKKGLNELADEATDDAFREITRRINGGFNGLPDRQQLYAAARATLGVTSAPVTRGAERGGPAPRTAEPDFDRGHEAILAAAPPRRARKVAPVKRRRKAAPGTRKRKAAPVKRSRKAAAIGRTRKAAPARGARTKKSKR